MQHAGQVSSAQFSPDSRWVVTTSKDYTARLWDANTGQAVASL
jgi:WD40 repeat protein